jgi:hypothetical protein
MLFNDSHPHPQIPQGLEEETSHLSIVENESQKNGQQKLGGRVEEKKRKLIHVVTKLVIKLGLRGA